MSWQPDKMTSDPWLPIGFAIPNGGATRLLKIAGDDWQIYSLAGGGAALIVKSKLAEFWAEKHLLPPGSLQQAAFAGGSYACLTSGDHEILAPVKDCRSPRCFEDVMSFAQSVAATRKAVGVCDLNHGIFCERFSCILPVSPSPSSDDLELSFGKWLTGGLPISVNQFSELSKTVSWLKRSDLRKALGAADFAIADAVTEKFDARNAADRCDSNRSGTMLDSEKQFLLPGRPLLQNFFHEHIIDIIRNRERYAAMGIEAPPSIILSGPPGCGKTYAVERLIEFLGWPSFSLDASTIASPYIHETSKKIAELFDVAISASPSILVIDEMEGFTGSREIAGGSHGHHLEEMSELLKKLPIAAKNGVIVIGLTNRIDLIDPAILRRGRFDHILEVGPATTEEIFSMLKASTQTVPLANDIDLMAIAMKLDDCPLSDVSFVVRESARLAARAGRSKIEREDVYRALESVAPRETTTTRKIGF